MCRLEDAAFSREARHISSTTFVSHIRFATTGRRTVENTHPYAIDGRIFAHNGVLGDLERLEAELGEDLSLVHGGAHIKPDLSVTSAVVVDGPPAQVLHLDHPTGQERS